MDFTLSDSETWKSTMVQEKFISSYFKTSENKASKRKRKLKENSLNKYTANEEHKCENKTHILHQKKTSENCDLNFLKRKSENKQLLLTKKVKGKNTNFVCEKIFKKKHKRETELSKLNFTKKTKELCQYPKKDGKLITASKNNLNENIFLNFSPNDKGNKKSIKNKHESKKRKNEDLNLEESESENDKLNETSIKNKHEGKKRKSEDLNLEESESENDEGNKKSIKNKHGGKKRRNEDLNLEESENENDKGNKTSIKNKHEGKKRKNEDLNLEESESESELRLQLKNSKIYKKIQMLNLNDLFFNTELKEKKRLPKNSIGCKKETFINNDKNNSLLLKSVDDFQLKQVKQRKRIKKIKLDEEVEGQDVCEKNLRLDGKVKHNKELNQNTSSSIKLNSYPKPHSLCINQETFKKDSALQINLKPTENVVETFTGKMTSNLLRNKALEKLKAAKFRYLNQKLYTESGKDSFKFFQKNRQDFEDYHRGYSLQVSKWPMNPVIKIINEIRHLPHSFVIADMGCGDAKIAQGLSDHQVFSFDLVALNKYVTPCDISKVPLSMESINVVVFCLSLMGTNVSDFISEAHRILKKGGLLKIAEVESRITNLDNFIRQIESFGFLLQVKNENHKLFVFLDFTKEKKKKSLKQFSNISLKPCLYKKR